MHDRAAQRLVIAGRLLQAKSNGFHRPIVKRDGETYPQAVLRVLQDDLPADERCQVKDLVDWLEDFETNDPDNQKEKGNAG